MPIYEFACQKCGKLVEQMLKVGQRGPSRCPHCRGRLKRVISRTSFQLKGGGWYRDLYSSPSQKSGEKSGETGETAAKTGDDKAAAPAAAEAKADKPAVKEAPAKAKKAEAGKSADAKKSVA